MGKQSAGDGGFNIHPPSKRAESLVRNFNQTKNREMEMDPLWIWQCLLKISKNSSLIKFIELSWSTKIFSDGNNELHNSPNSAKRLIFTQALLFLLRKKGFFLSGIKHLFSKSFNDTYGKRFGCPVDHKVGNSASRIRKIFKSYLHSISIQWIDSIPSVCNLGTHITVLRCFRMIYRFHFHRICEGPTLDTITRKRFHDFGATSRRFPAEKRNENLISFPKVFLRPNHQSKISIAWGYG